MADGLRGRSNYRLQVAESILSCRLPVIRALPPLRLRKQLPRRGSPRLKRSLSGAGTRRIYE